ncbi:unnamed protein product [Dicrocoelium dendriticum]|nr:unnamed protein product [Dicrocoelium dendriticum]
MVDEQLKSVTSATRLSGIHRQASISVHLRGSKRSGGSLARAYKLAQYYRIIPCLYSEQVFCYAACLLKWFRLEAMRQEALSVVNIKGHHGERHTTPLAPTLSMADLQSQKAVDMAPNENARQPMDVFLESHNVDDYAASPSVIPALQESDMESKTTTQTDESVVEKKPKISSSESDGDRTSPTLAAEQRTVPDRPIYGVVNKSILTRINYGNSRERRDTYRLAFGAMKYIAIIEKLLDEIAFYLEHAHLKDEEHLVLVLVYDYTIRNFQRRVPLPDERQLPTLERYMEYLPSGRLVLHPPGTEIFKMVEEAVQAMCMRLAAAVARVRVRNQVGSLRLLLPEEWRSSEQMAEVMPTYGWYNQLLGKQDIVTGWLKDHGFRRIMAGRSPQPLEYASDKHCSDVFIFNKADVSNLLDSEIVQQKNLVFQDKSSCLGVHCCLANIAGGEEVMFVNCINVYSAVHMEGLIGNKFPLIQPVPQIRCVRATKEDEDVRLAAKMGSKGLSSVPAMTTVEKLPPCIPAKTDSLTSPSLTSLRSVCLIFLFALRG